MSDQQNPDDAMPREGEPGTPAQPPAPQTPPQPPEPPAPPTAPPAPPAAPAAGTRESPSIQGPSSPPQPAQPPAAPALQEYGQQPQQAAPAPPTYGQQQPGGGPSNPGGGQPPMPPAGGQQPPYAPYQGQPPVEPPMNPLALVAFIGSFFVSLVGIICGHIALKQTKRDGTRGQGFALAGLIIGYVALGLQVLTAIVLIIMLSVFGVTMGALFSAADSASRSMEDLEATEEPDTEYRFGYAPENMLSGGAVFGEGLEVIPTPALGSGEDRVAPDVDRSSLPLDVTVYVDYMCPACGSFEQTYGTTLENYVAGGDITLQVYPLNFLDSMSAGGEYSTRAANLFSCLVEQQPETAFDAHSRLLSAEVQPAEGTEGLTDDELLDVAEDAGALVDDRLEGCVREVPFEDFLDENTRVATSEGMLGLVDGQRPVTSTPTVVVNGVPWEQAGDGDLEEHLLKLKAEIES